MSEYHQLHFAGQPAEVSRNFQRDIQLAALISGLNCTKAALRKARFRPASGGAADKMLYESPGLIPERALVLHSLLASSGALCFACSTMLERFIARPARICPALSCNSASDMPSLVILYLQHPIRQIPQVRGLFQPFIVPLIQFFRSGSNLCF